MAQQDSGNSLTIEPSGFTPLDPETPPADEPRRPRRLALYAAMVLFVLVMGFLLTARSLQVVVDTVSPAEVEVSGLALPFGERYLLRPGDYDIRVTAEGYHPLITRISVDRADSQTVELAPRALPGRVSITTMPPGANVTLDGELLGITPLTELAIEAGEHQLVLQEPRHLVVERDLEVTGRNIQEELVVELAPAWAVVTVDSLPAGATVLVDGENAGTTPASLEILQGERQLMLQLPSWANWEQTMEITAGEAQDLGRIKLQPAPGLLALNSAPAGANVTLDGEFQGQTPLTLEVTPGRSHRLAVFKPGYRRYNGTVELDAAEQSERTVELEAELGRVEFRIYPADAVLRLNGRPVGQGSQTLSLPAVEHRVSVSKSGYASVKRRVTPRPGLPQLVEISLNTHRAARMARIKLEITTSVGQTLLLFKPAESPMAKFNMGASRREPGRRANEVLHPVALERMFYLQTTEVTNAQFRQFDPGHNSGQIDGNSLNREHQPVAGVSWQQAASYCNWLSAREGLPAFYKETQGIITGFNPRSTGYRLPTEAEWAWAARADGTRLLKFPWGDTFPPDTKIENYADNASAYVTGRILNGYNDGHVVSATVASFGPNHRGLYDMGGNVAEWVHDVYAIPSANGATRVDPQGAQSGDNYVIRGAAWTHSRLAELRLSYRDYGQAGRDDVGFRIARYAE